MGFYSPIELQRIGSLGSISYVGQNVNIEAVPFSDIFMNDVENKYYISGDVIRNLNTKKEQHITELTR